MTTLNTSPKSWTAPCKRSDQICTVVRTSALSRWQADMFPTRAPAATLIHV